MIAAWRVGLAVLLLAGWQIGTSTGVLPPLFFGRPVKIAGVIWQWFASGDIWPHLAVTLSETLMAFGSGTVAGVAAGLWLGLSPRVQAVASPFINAANAMPRVILAPIFAMWFGLGMASKVALGFTLVFFIVFFNVLQGGAGGEPGGAERNADAGGVAAAVGAACVFAGGAELGVQLAACFGGDGVRGGRGGGVSGECGGGWVFDIAGGGGVRC